MYDYILVADSVEIHRGENNAAGSSENAAAAVGAAAGGSENLKSAGGGGGGLLSKFSRRLLGRNYGDDGNDLLPGGSDNVRGPKPILTAKLANVAPFTSTALTAQVYGGNCDNNLNSEEELNISVHLHEDGVARIRITEVLGDDVRSTPRWTSDELVLNEKEMIGAGEETVQIVSTDTSIQSKLSLDGEERISKDVAEQVVTSLTQRAKVDGPNDNFIVLSYGPPGSKQWQLMLQLEPFSVYFFRGTDDGPPMVVAGTGGLTHFEIRRDKECNSSGSSAKGAAEGKHQRKLTEFDVGDDEEEEEGENEEEDRHGGKEIVGYWEDGLAIYADGTREERRELESPAGEEEGGAEDLDEEMGVDKGEGREQRRLDEEEFDTAGM